MLLVTGFWTTTIFIVLPRLTIAYYSWLILLVASY